MCWLLGDATEKHSPHHLKIETLNHDDAAAIRGREPSEQNWPGRAYSLSPVSDITQSWASVSACMWKKVDSFHLNVFCSPETLHEQQFRKMQSLALCTSEEAHDCPALLGW